MSKSLYRVKTTEWSHQETQKVHTTQVNWSEPALNLLQVDRPRWRSRSRTPLSTSVHPVALKTW